MTILLAVSIILAVVGWLWLWLEMSFNKDTIKSRDGWIDNVLKERSTARAERDTAEKAACEAGNKFETMKADLNAQLDTTTRALATAANDVVNQRATIREQGIKILQLEKQIAASTGYYYLKTGDAIKATDEVKFSENTEWEPATNYSTNWIIGTTYQHGLNCPYRRRIPNTEIIADLQDRLKFYRESAGEFYQKMEIHRVFNDNNIAYGKLLLKQANSRIMSLTAKIGAVERYYRNWIMVQGVTIPTYREHLQSGKKGKGEQNERILGSAGFSGIQD